MIHAGIGDLPADNYEKILTKMYEKFLPHIKDLETVEREFSALIKECAKALFVKLTEKIHIWSQYFKK